jgi:hypothetical protein
MSCRLSAAVALDDESDDAWDDESGGAWDGAWDDASDGVSGGEWASLRDGVLGEMNQTEMDRPPSPTQRRSRERRDQ